MFRPRQDELSPGRYLRLVGGETVCGNLGGLFVGFLFDRANNVHDSFTGGNALQRRITQSFLLNFMQLVPDPQHIGTASRATDAACERLRIQSYDSLPCSLSDLVSGQDLRMYHLATRHEGALAEHFANLYHTALPLPTRV